MILVCVYIRLIYVDQLKDCISLFNVINHSQTAAGYNMNRQILNES